MKKAIRTIFAGLIAGTLILLVGCKAQVGTKTGGKDKPSSPYGGGPGLGKDSEKGGGSAKLSAEDEELIVPGSQYGNAPPINTGKKKKGKKGKKSSDEDLPYADTIAEQMEGLEWGMTYKKVISIFEEQVQTRFAEDLAAAAGDALIEDQVRTKIRRAIGKLRKSYVTFDGQTTGFEGHMIADEFTHNNRESMLMWDAGKYVEYLFFFNGRFWKRLRAFRIDSFKTEISFPTFLATLENRFGEGRAFFDDKSQLDKVMWRDESTYVAALDRSGFFGAFGLRFSAAVTETFLDQLRPHKGKSDGSVNDDISKMVESVTDGSGALTDHESSVIDGYTGGKPTDTGQLDATHSVTAGKKKDKPKEEAQESKKSDKGKETEKPDKDFVDDLF